MRVSKASSRGSDDIEAEEGDSGEEEDALSDGDIEDSDDELGTWGTRPVAAAVPMLTVYVVYAPIPLPVQHTAQARYGLCVRRQAPDRSAFALLVLQA